MTTTRTLADVTHYIRGITFKPEELVEVGAPDSVVCMRTKNVQEELDESDLIAVPKRLVRNPDKYLQPGDILLSSANSWELVGKCSYVGSLSYCATAGGFISIVRPRQNQTHPRFLYHWLNSPSMQHTIRHLGRQTTNISNLDVDRFKKLEFPAIGCKDQGRIAAILDKADGVRRKREWLLGAGEDFLKAAFLEIFGDPVSNPRAWSEGVIGDCLLKVVGGWSAKGEARPAGRDEMGVLKISAVTSGEYIPSENKVVSSIPNTKNLVIPQVGDLLFSRANTRELVAATCIVLEAPQNVFLPDKLWRLDLNKDVAEASYIKFVLAHRDYRAGLCSRATGTSGSMLNISMAKLLEHPIPIPPIDSQKKFAALWYATKRAAQTLKKQVEDGNNLFDSLAQRAFRGEL